MRNSLSLPTILTGAPGLAAGFDEVPRGLEATALMGYIPGTI